MTVVCDNSALSALSEAGLDGLLPALFGWIAIPDAVRVEGCHPAAPQVLRSLVSSPPGWLKVVADPVERLRETAELGAGEAASIGVAWEHRPDSWLILDERRARVIANALGLRMSGTVAIVGEAAARGMVVFDDGVSRLRATGFYLADGIVEAVRRRLNLN